MCERDSCQILDAITTETSTEECKCQTSFSANLQQQKEENEQQQSSKFHHCIKEEKTNVNMLRQQQQMHPHIQQMTFLDYYNCASTGNSAATASVTMTNPTSLESMSHNCKNQSYLPDDRSSSQATNSPPASPSIGVNLRVTGQCSQGGRKYMEDYFSVAYQQSDNAKDLEYAFIGIYDGHGGAEAATFAKEHLMLEIINQKLFWSDSDHDVLQAIREGYIATHYAMWREQEKWPRTANGLLSTAGTTATIAFIRREKIYIGHVGDSGIVLGYQNEQEHFWRAKQLTTDHKPESFTERTRILRSGGKVVVKSGVPRVVWNRPRNAGHKGPIRRSTPVDEVPFLAVARSLGDLWSYNSARNEFVVSPDPDVKVVKINPKTFRCLIFGTDGLWNVVSPQEAVDTVFEKERFNERLLSERGEGGGEWTNPSKGLVERALKTWSAKKMRADNTSVVTVILYPPCNAEPTGDRPVSHNTLEQCSMPDSCGLEYSQVCAEIPVQDCGVTYQEMAEKYLPPEDYRNFNYYDDMVQEISCAERVRREEERNGELDPLMLKCHRTPDIMHWCNKSQSCSDVQMFSEDTNPWSWNEKCEQDDLRTGGDSSLCRNEHCIGSAIDGNGDSNENDENEEVDDDNEVGDEGETCLQNQGTVINYTHYITDASTSTSSLNTKVGPNAMQEVMSAGGYLTSFAESYNSLLNEQMSQEVAASGSNSSPGCQSISGTHMHEILQEQQLYQQQCMSEEEGYSLTKLETRREQQRYSDVQTFKIFQANEGNQPNNINASSNQLQGLPQTLSQQQMQHQPPSQHLTTVSAQDLTEAMTWEPICPTISAAMSRLLAYQQQQQQQHQQQQHQQAQSQKPLELNSLLQQEREEEQQVALERLEMQRQLAIASAAPVSVSPIETADVDLCNQYVDATTAESVSESIEEGLVEEYLEDEDDDDEMLEKEIAVTRLDELVQINEISSSIADSAETHSISAQTLFIEETGTVDESVQPASRDLAVAGALPSHILPSVLVEKIEKIEILREKLELSENERNNTTAPLLKGSPLPTCFLKSEVLQTSRPPKACPARTSLKRSQTHFPNIPNENSRLSLTASAHSLRKRRRYDPFAPLVSHVVAGTSSTTELPQSVSGSSCSEKRQLRSNTVVDYSKRTLRTRNSLTKDLKAKSSLASTMKRATTQFLHTTAVSLMNAHAATLAHQKSQHHQHQQCVNSNYHTARSLNSSCSRKSKAEKQVVAEPTLESCPTTATSTLSHVINLRSRQVGQLTSKPISTSVTHRKTNTNNSLSASALLAGTTSRRERRNLRSLSARNSSSRGNDGDVSGLAMNFSKSTRLQTSMRSTFGVPPPPSPKLINAAAAVAAATRARSLVTAKNAAAVGGAIATRNVTPLSKRASLRSGSGAAAATTPMTTRSSRANRKLKR